MERNLLLGNGINAHLNVEGMKGNEIKERFIRALINSNEFFDLIFKVRFTDEICNEIFSKLSNDGIETLAKGVYDFVKNKRVLSSNDEIRLLSTITCCGVTAIFYDKDKVLGKNFDKKRLPDFSKYKNVFSLNYAEAWDKGEKCKYLHRRYDPSAEEENGKEILECGEESLHQKCDFLTVEENGKEILIYDVERHVGHNGYKEVVRKLKPNFNMIGLNTWYVIFSPEFQKMEEEFRNKKSRLINGQSFPAEDRDPAEDIFPRDLEKLYDELEGVRQIEVFGMSPYGDDELIEKLNHMDFVTVYIYNFKEDDKKENGEARAWDKVLTCPHRLIDSNEIMKV